MLSHWVEKTIRTVVKAAWVLSAVALLIGVGINFVNVIGRYVFHSPIIWAEEIMLYLMLGMVFLGAGAASLEGRHIRMDVALHLFPRKFRTAFDVLADLAFLVVALMVIRLGVPVVLKFAAYGQLSDAANIPIWIPHSMIPLGFSIMTLATLLRMLARFSPKTFPITARQSDS